MITREDLAVRLLEIVDELRDAEREAVSAARQVSAAKEDLADREAALLLAGVPGSNAEARAAHLRQETTSWRMGLQQAQEEAQLAGVRLRVLQAELLSLRACARLIGGEE